MDITLLFKALILGVVEGLTEFLPISSTGHLIILGDLLGYNDETSKVFKIVIQLAAILAVCWDYRERLTKMVVGLPNDKPSQRFATMLFVGFLPAAVLGLMFHSQIKALLFNPITVATALIVGGFIILYVEKRAYHPTINSLDEMGWRDALKVGFAQALAMIPVPRARARRSWAGWCSACRARRRRSFRSSWRYRRCSRRRLTICTKTWLCFRWTTCLYSRWVSSPRSSRRCGR
jgi:undecaprenyl pyrophosphate phosphatase UppP